MATFPRTTDARALEEPVTLGVSQSRQSANLPVSLPSSWADKTARFKALHEEALAAAGGTIGVDFSGSSTTAGGKITITNIATKKFTEKNYNSVFRANNITEVRDAPEIEVTHEKVASMALENIDSQTKATQNATITQTNTLTMAGGNLGISYHAPAGTLTHTETNVVNHGGKDQTITRKANEINLVVNGQQVPEASTNDDRQGRM